MILQREFFQFVSRNWEKKSSKFSHKKLQPVVSWPFKSTMLWTLRFTLWFPDVEVCFGELAL